MSGSIFPGSVVLSYSGSGVAMGLVDLTFFRDWLRLTFGVSSVLVKFLYTVPTDSRSQPM